MNAPEPGSVWRHYRTGQRYVVVGLATHTSSDGYLIVYHRADQHPDRAQLWARPLAEWEEAVSVGEASTPRFVRIGTRPAGGAS